MDAGTTIALIAYFIIGIVIPIAASVAFGVCSANIARKKGYSYGGFFALGFFTWLIGLIIALCLNDRNPAPDPSHEAVSTADSILKYKMLLDQGAITPAEFDAKKAALLGVAAASGASPGVPGAGAQPTAVPDAGAPSQPAAAAGTTIPAAPKKHRTGCVVAVVIGTVLFIAIAVLVCLFMFTRVCEVRSGSMEDTIMAGDGVAVENVSYRFGTPLPGDVIAFQDPEIPDRTLFKRVIATEGQVVDLVDGQGYVDGAPRDEPYTAGKPTYPLTPAYGTSITYPYEVPAGQLWVMGDNRTNSQDSRYFGAIPASSVIGKALL